MTNRDNGSWEDKKINRENVIIGLILELYEGILILFADRIFGRGRIANLASNYVSCLSGCFILKDDFLCIWSTDKAQ